MNLLFKNKKTIFLTLIIGKGILLPLIYFALNYFDGRENALFLLGDLERYEASHNIFNIFNIGIWEGKPLVSNVGYMILVSVVQNLTNIENIKLLIYSIISLLTISYSQTILLNIIFLEKKK